MNSHPESLSVSTERPGTLSPLVLVVAGGVGSRLSDRLPKPLIRFPPEGPTLLERTVKTFRSALEEFGVTECAVISPQVMRQAKEVFEIENIRIQPTPSGTATGVMTAADLLCNREVVITWIDQPLLEPLTIKKFFQKSRLTVTTKNGFMVVLGSENGSNYCTWYMDGNRLKTQESREGEIPRGTFSDCGVFYFSRGDILLDSWTAFLSKNIRGAATQEFSFVKYLEFVSENNCECFLDQSVSPKEMMFINTSRDYELALDALNR